jgi:hypothetical protein
MMKQKCSVRNEGQEINARNGTVIKIVTCKKIYQTNQTLDCRSSYWTGSQTTERGRKRGPTRTVRPVYYKKKECH